MPRAYASTVISESAHAVWAVVRDFNGLPDWHPGIAKSEIESGLAADRVGAIRSFTLQDGTPIREKLLALSDSERSMTYDFQTWPFPVRDYRATLRVTPVTDGSGSFVEWWATFSAAEQDEATMINTFATSVFQPGFTALKQRFTR